jgi:hypothetical protein
MREYMVNRVRIPDLAPEGARCLPHTIVTAMCSAGFVSTVVTAAREVIRKHRDCHAAITKDAKHTMATKKKM